MTLYENGFGTSIGTTEEIARVTSGLCCDPKGVKFYGWHTCEHDRAICKIFADTKFLTELQAE